MKKMVASVFGLFVAFGQVNLRTDEPSDKLPGTVGGTWLGWLFWAGVPVALLV